MPYQFIGRTNHFKGHTLWELLSNLKNFGVGRIVIRNKFQRYPEPCYFKILKVAALPEPPHKPFKLNMVNDLTKRKCRVLVERTFRGQTFEKYVQLESATYKDDYQLIPKTEEYKFLDLTKKREEVILPRTMELPPLLREIIIRNMKAKGESVTQDPEMEVYYNNYGHKASRVAKVGEKPTVTLTIGLGTPVTPKLYEGVKPI